MNDINRHIVVVWQSIATLGAAVATFSLVKDNILSSDVATSIVLIACIWLIAHVFDASYWYNRNLVIIANIERQFLKNSDQRDIHYYFGKHRPKNSMISHLRIQMYLGIAIGLLVMLSNFIEKIVPIICKTSIFELQNLLPWLVFGIGVIVLYNSHKKSVGKYSEFLENSPGIEVDTTGIKFGLGHGFSNKQL